MCRSAQIICPRAKLSSQKRAKILFYREDQFPTHSSQKQKWVPCECRESERTRTSYSAVICEKLESTIFNIYTTWSLGLDNKPTNEPTDKPIHLFVLYFLVICFLYFWWNVFDFSNFNCLLQASVAPQKQIALCISAAARNRIQIPRIFFYKTALHKCRRK